MAKSDRLAFKIQSQRDVTLFHVMANGDIPYYTKFVRLIICAIFEKSHKLSDAQIFKRTNFQTHKLVKNSKKKSTKLPLFLKFQNAS